MDVLWRAISFIGDSFDWDKGIYPEGVIAFSRFMGIIVLVFIICFPFILMGVYGSWYFSIIYLTYPIIWFYFLSKYRKYKESLKIIEFPEFSRIKVGGKDGNLK